MCTQYSLVSKYTVFADTNEYNLPKIEFFNLGLGLRDLPGSQGVKASSKYPGRFHAAKGGTNNLVAEQTCCNIL